MLVTLTGIYRHPSCCLRNVRDTVYLESLIELSTIDIRDIGASTTVVGIELDSDVTVDECAVAHVAVVD